MSSEDSRRVWGSAGRAGGEDGSASVRSSSALPTPTTLRDALPYPSSETGRVELATLLALEWLRACRGGTGLLATDGGRVSLARGWAKSEKVGELVSGSGESDRLDASERFDSVGDGGTASAAGGSSPSPSCAVPYPFVCCCWP